MMEKIEEDKQFQIEMQAQEFMLSRLIDEK
jgi:hypothetical protein